MSGDPIRILDLTPVAYVHGGRTPRYRFPTSFEWVSTTQTLRRTPEEAYADAEAWCEAYRQRDPMGNMADALGVAHRDGGFVGVMNYYHSGT